MLIHLAGSFHSWRFPNVEAAPLVTFLGLVLAAVRTRASVSQLATVGVGVVVFGFLGARGGYIVTSGQIPCFSAMVFPIVMLWTAVLTSASGKLCRGAAPRLPSWAASIIAVLVAPGAATLVPDQFNGLFLFPMLAAGGAIGFELGRRTYGALMTIVGRSGAPHNDAGEFLFSLAATQAFSVLPVKILQESLSNAGC